MALAERKIGFNEEAPVSWGAGRPTLHRKLLTVTHLTSRARASTQHLLPSAPPL